MTCAGAALHLTLITCLKSKNLYVNIRSEFVTAVNIKISVSVIRCQVDEQILHSALCQKTVSLIRNLPIVQNHPVTCRKLILMGFVLVEILNINGWVVLFSQFIVTASFMK